MWNLFKKNKRYRFTHEDDEAAAAMKDLHREQRRLEIEALRAEVKTLRRRTFGHAGRRDENPGSLLKKFRELDELREYLSPEQEQEVEEGGLTALLPILMQLSKAQSGDNGIPQDETALKGALKHQGKRQKKGTFSDSTDIIISKIPMSLKNQIKKGIIPKQVARDFARNAADKEFNKVWKRLTGKN